MQRTGDDSMRHLGVIPTTSPLIPPHSEDGSQLPPAMSGPAKYLLVSLPNSISPSNDHDEALTALRAAVSTDLGTTWPFLVPQFKIGALDALIQQADDLAKLSADCEAVVGKIADSLSSILEGDQDKLAQQKTVNNSTMPRRPE